MYQVPDPSQFANLSFVMEIYAVCVCRHRERKNILDKCGKARKWWAILIPQSYLPATETAQMKKVKAHLILTVVCGTQIPLFNFVYGLEKVNFKPCFSC